MNRARNDKVQGGGANSIAMLETDNSFHKTQTTHPLRNLSSTHPPNLVISSPAKFGIIDLTQPGREIYDKGNLVINEMTRFKRRD